MGQETGLYMARDQHGITLQSKSLQKEGQTSLFPVSIKRVFVAHPIYQENRSSCLRDHLGKGNLWQGNIDGRGKHTLPRIAVIAWKGCASAGAEPGSPGVPEQLPISALKSLFIPGFIHILQNKLPRASFVSLVAFLPGAFGGLFVLTGPLLK